MKKILNLLLVIATMFCFSQSFAQTKDYVKFSKEPTKKILMSDLSKTPFYVEYRLKKEGHLYLVLRKNNKPVANIIVPVRSRRPEQLELKLTNLLTKKVIAGSGYSLNLTLCEGPKNSFANKIGSTIRVKDIIVTRLN